MVILILTKICNVRFLYSVVLSVVFCFDSLHYRDSWFPARKTRRRPSAPFIQLSLMFSTQREGRPRTGGLWWCTSGCVVERGICNWVVAGSNLAWGYFAPRSTQPCIPLGLVNEYQLRLGRQMQVWLIPIADERVGVQVKLWDPLGTRAIPERICGDNSLLIGATSSVCTFTFTSEWQSDCLCPSIMWPRQSMPSGPSVADSWQLSVNTLAVPNNIVHTTVVGRQCLNKLPYPISPW